MNKEELIADLKSRIIKIIKEYDKKILNGGDSEYSFLCLVDQNGGFQEVNYSIRVVDEGLETEQAGYVNGKQPPCLKTDLEVGLGLLLAKDSGAKVLVQVSDKIFKVKLSNNSIVMASLNAKKTDLVFAPSE